MVVFLLRIDRDTNYNFILLIIEKLIIIFYLCTRQISQNPYPIRVLPS